MSVPICKNCKHHYFPKLHSPAEPHHWCTLRRGVPNRVTGDYTFTLASWARGDGQYCGPDGKLFEQKKTLWKSISDFLERYGPF